VSNTHTQSHTRPTWAFVCAQRQQKSRCINRNFTTLKRNETVSAVPQSKPNIHTTSQEKYWQKLCRTKKKEKRKRKKKGHWNRFSSTPPPPDIAWAGSCFKSGRRKSHSTKLIRYRWLMSAEYGAICFLEGGIHAIGNIYLYIYTHTHASFSLSLSPPLKVNDWSREPFLSPPLQAGEKRRKENGKKIGQRSKCFDSPFSLYLNYIFNEYGRGENNRLENSSKGIEREKNKKKG
jgi:hypothetical protein